MRWLLPINWSLWDGPLSVYDAYYNWHVGSRRWTREWFRWFVTCAPEEWRRW